MSRASGNARRADTRATVFAALGDRTRLSLVATLSDGRTRSVSQLTRGSALTRQAVSKHLRVLERAGVVRRERSGRESRYALDPEPIEDLRRYLQRVSAQWDDAIARLQRFVEERPQ